MSKVKTYSEFIVESFSVETLNETLMDKMKPALDRIAAMFKDTTKLNKQVDAAEEKAGTTDDNLSSKSIKNGTSVIVKLTDPQDEAKKSLLSLTKLADLPDGSGLFQITGSDSPDFLKSLASSDVAHLNTMGVMAIIGPEGLVTTKNLTMYIYKNVNAQGKPIITEAVIKASLSTDLVIKEAGA